MTIEQIDTEIAVLKNYVNTPIGAQTDEQINDVCLLLQFYEITNVFECPICIVEHCITLYRILMKKREEITKEPTLDPQYILKDEVNVIFGSDLINELTITDEKAEQWIRRGFPLLFFKKYPINETTTK